MRFHACGFMHAIVNSCAINVNNIHPWLHLGLLDSYEIAMISYCDMKQLTTTYIIHAMFIHVSSSTLKFIQGCFTILVLSMIVASYWVQLSITQLQHIREMYNYISHKQIRLSCIYVDIQLHSQVAICTKLLEMEQQQAIQILQTM